MQLGKGWSLLRLPAPAPKHQLIQAQGAGWGPGQVHLPALIPEELPRVLDHLLIRELPKGLGPAEHQHLPQGHPKGPHVTCGRELPHEDTLPGHPPDGQHRPALHAVIIPSIEVPAHAKVGNFDGEIFPDQAVPCGQVDAQS